MKKLSKLNKYVELFIKNIQKYLSKNICIHSVIHPVHGSGAVFEFFLKPGAETSQSVKPTEKSVSAVLSKIPQNMIAGDLNNVHFGGTSIYLEGNRIIVIKGEDKSEYWSGTTVKNDVMRVVSSSQGAHQ